MTTPLIGENPIPPLYPSFNSLILTSIAYIWTTISCIRPRSPIKQMIEQWTYSVTFVPDIEHGIQIF